MQKPLKLLPVLFASAFLAAHCHADVFGSGANQFTIDFVNIGYAGNAANFVDYGTTPDFGNTNYNAPYQGYGSVNYSYGIGKYEVTIDQFSKANAASGGQIGNGNEDIWNSQQPNPFNDPLNYGVYAPASAIYWHEAAKFVNWLSSGDANTGVYQFSGNTLTGINRSYRNGNDLAYVLPTDDEWYKAAFYKPIDDGTYSLYSSGLDSTPSTNGWNYNPNHAFKPVWETGSGTEEQNGTYDMMGNVWEWTETEVNGDYVVRGGSAYAPEEYLDSTTYRPVHASEEWENIGFRVAVIPEPSTIGFMAAMGVAVFGIRRIFSI